MYDLIGQKVRIKYHGFHVEGILGCIKICGDEMWSLETKKDHFMHIYIEDVKEIKRI